MSTTLTITAEHQALRTVVAGFAEATSVPPEIRECLVESLREFLPGGMDNEQIGWTLQALSGALLHLSAYAIEVGGPGTADKLLSPNLLGVIASTAEGFVSEAALPAWTW